MTELVKRATLGEAWLDIAERDRGEPATYDGKPILELAHATFELIRGVLAQAPATRR